MSQKTSRILSGVVASLVALITSLEASGALPASWQGGAQLVVGALGGLGTLLLHPAVSK